jgi:hypothetical protein
VREGTGFGANLQLAVHHDPLGAQFQVGLVCKAELATDRDTAQRGRTHVKDHFLAAFDRDLLSFSWHLLVWPGGGIGPECFLGLGTTVATQQETHW